MTLRVLSLCDLTGNMVRPWVEAGHDATIVDLQHPARRKHDGIHRVGLDVRTFEPRDHYDIVFAFPSGSDRGLENAPHVTRTATGQPALGHADGIRPCRVRGQRRGAHGKDRIVTDLVCVQCSQPITESQVAMPSYQVPGRYFHSGDCPKGEQHDTR